MPGPTGDPGDIGGAAAFAASLGNVSRLDVLPFHKPGGAEAGARHAGDALTQARPKTG
ncbi:hypothetical protein [Streptomyces sp. NBC_00247]|uniref:hypothetical protein n=1 Tax=Streptomyces sp. NBC_00247 TaxID=2975689 RepID=UPI002E2890E2|nr:hypothetical protein [Streptomyces sp. NBC_00247]